MKASRRRQPVSIAGMVILILSLTIPSLAPAGPSPALSEAQSIEDQGQATGNYQDRMVRDFEQAVAWAQPLLERYGHLAVFLAILAEGFGILAPGQTLLMAASLAAAQGRMNIVWVFLLAFTAAVLGNSLGYLLGRWGGGPLLRKIGVNERHLARMEGYFSRWGKLVVLFGRFVDGLRQLNGIVAGMLEMPWRVFTIFNILGAALWTGVWGLGVYFLDKEIVSLHLSLHQIKTWVAAFCLLAFLALLWYLLRPGQKKGMGRGPGT